MERPRTNMSCLALEILFMVLNREFSVGRMTKWGTIFKLKMIERALDNLVNCSLLNAMTLEALGKSCI